VWSRQEKGEICRLFVEYLWILMSWKHEQKAGFFVEKKAFPQTLLIKPHLQNWKRSIKSYLKFEVCGNFRRYSGKNLVIMISIFHKRDKKYSFGKKTFCRKIVFSNKIKVRNSTVPNISTYFRIVIKLVYLPESEIVVLRA
jgi:hypothetical protein